MIAYIHHALSDFIDQFHWFTLALARQPKSEWNQAGQQP
jgi:hypothetical protein